MTGRKNLFVWKKVEQLKATTDDNKYNQVIVENGKKIQHHYCWINGIDYHGDQFNYIECEETIENIEDNEKKVSRFFCQINGFLRSRI